MTDIEFYQSLGMKDEESEKISRKTSQYWNEGKWDNFIAPLLPKDCGDMTFLDIGCNCGLYLKMAKDWGFRDVVGVEKDIKTYERAIKFKEHIKGNYKILHREVGKDFSFDEVFTILPSLFVNLAPFKDNVALPIRLMFVVLPFLHLVKYWNMGYSLNFIFIMFYHH